mgnify:CR=1 FL=1
MANFSYNYVIYKSNSDKIVDNTVEVCVAWSRFKASMWGGGDALELVYMATAVGVF